MSDKCEKCENFIRNDINYGPLCRIFSWLNNYNDIPCNNEDYQERGRHE